MSKFLSILVIAAVTAVSALGHGDNSHYAPAQDVTVRVTKVSGNVYMLQGRGGNVGAIVGDDGTLIVDDDYKAVSEKLRDALDKLGSSKPRYIFNTHWHGDHTEGNMAFGRDATIIAHINVRKRLMQTNSVLGMTVPPYPEYAWPMLTFNRELTLSFAGDDVRAVHYPTGHTDGDSVIFFTKANVVHMGDLFFKGRFPFVDVDNGGSVQGVIDNVGTLLTQIPADAKIIPGHGPLANLDDLKQFREALIETSGIVRAAIKKRRTIDQIKKAGLPEKYKTWGEGFIKQDVWLEILYKSYTKK